MIIREQGQQLQLIRSPYDPAKKRCTQKVIATFEKRFTYDMDKILSDDKLNNIIYGDKHLSDDERKKLTEWLQARVDSAVKFSAETAVRYAKGRITEIAAALASDAVVLDQAGAEAIYAAMDALTAALKARKLKRPKAPAPAPAPKAEEKGLFPAKPAAKKPAAKK